MSTMWIRVKRDGYLFPYDDILAKNPDCEVIPEEVAFPEKFITPVVQEAIERYAVVNDTPEPETEPAPVPAPAAVQEKRPRGRPRKKGLDLSTDDIPEPPQYTPPELAADAARGLP